MTPRLNHFTANPAAMQALLEAGKVVHGGSLDAKLRELVQVRASQINGCAYCLHYHLADARKAGETEDRLHLLSAWRESTLYSERERAALAWTEALTLIADTHAPDEDYAALAKHFTPAEQVQLSLLIGLVNAWNRLNIGFRPVHAADKRKAA
jgi:AhpD family alkylhydroperoxidase